MIEEAPKYENFLDQAIPILLNPKYQDAINRINQEYLYWDKVKYRTPEDLDSRNFWAAVKYSRRGEQIAFAPYTFQLEQTNYMQQLLHEFDMNFGGTLTSSAVISEKNRQYYLLSSIMEEAIASSQMEGANTTRKVAKEMLRKQAKPKDKSQQMIVNNYNTIRYLSEHQNEDLSIELLLDIHKKITEKTLDNPQDEGRFRTEDNIIVANGITGEVAHEPPPCTLLYTILKQICDFANQDKFFIHPVLKAIIIHFMISFLHPFVDGNGRTARSLFYWYMLKKGYWMTEFLSISRIIYKKKSQYEKAFLYTEHDNLDLGYFVTFNLRVLKESYEELKLYLERKSKEENSLVELKIHGINERQAQIIKLCMQKPSSLFVCKELVVRFNVNVKTIRSDLAGLVELGLLQTIPVNKRLVGYTRALDFDGILSELRGN
ncbi:MAG: Fic family protein [Treponema sp.]|nr:Fic family protein [Treponema sp.]